MSKIQCFEILNEMVSLDYWNLFHMQYSFNGGSDLIF